MAYGYTLGHYEAYGKVLEKYYLERRWQCPYVIDRRNYKGFDPDVFQTSFPG